MDGYKFLQHEVGAAFDHKHRAVRAQFGASAYGLYWIILEEMASTFKGGSNHLETTPKLPLNHIELILSEAKIGGDDGQKVIDAMVAVGLFQSTKDGLECKALGERMSRFYEQKEAMSQGGLKGASSRLKGGSKVVDSTLGKVNINQSNYKDKDKESITTPLWGDCQRVRLTPEKYDTLKEKYPDIDHYIEAIDAYCLSKGKSYKDYGAAVVSWVLADIKGGKREAEPYDWRKDPAWPLLGSKK